MLKNAVFGLFYVMTEGSPQEASDTMWKFSLLLYLIDMFQLLRTMGSARYGWTDSSVDVIRNLDIVNVLTDQALKVLPYLVLYVLGVILVLSALADAGYVIKLLNQGEVKLIWPLKVLRFMVASIVTTIFTTVLEWIIYPVDCWSHPEETFSDLIQGTQGKCTPWRTPELVATIPSLLIAALYIIFSLGTTLMNFEINPLSRFPNASNSGRVEMAWTALKVCAILLVFIEQHIHRIVVATALSLVALAAMYEHFRLLPFNCLFTNIWRGGIVTATGFFSLSNILVAIYPNSQVLQWTLIGLVPLSFLMGTFLVWQRHIMISNFAGLLRKEFRALAEEDDSPKPRNRRKSLISVGSAKWSHNSFKGPKGGEPQPQRTVYEKFFQKEWDSERAFKSPAFAHTVARHVLAEREEHDLPFLKFLIDKAIREHPDSEDLQIFQLMASRFVFRDVPGAASQEKLLALKKNGMALDRAYTLYAVSRRANQEFIGASLGKGDISAINVMEFDSKMDQARKSHLKCVGELKKFWRLAMRAGKKSIGDSWTDDMVARLEGLEHAIAEAKQEYSWLLDKYPASASLLLSSAHFTDTVLNDPAAAEKQRHQAALLEEVTGTPSEDDEIQPGKGMGNDDDGKSSSTGESEGSRISMQKYMATWSVYVMGAEQNQLTRLSRRVKLALCLLVILATVGFSLIDLVLYTDVALSNINLIDKTGLFRAYSVTSAFFLRGQMIAAYQNNSEVMGNAAGIVHRVTGLLKERHSLNYDMISNGEVADFYDHRMFSTVSPIGNRWQRRDESYWTMGHDFVRRARQAADISMEELTDPDFRVQSGSEPKRNFAFVHENVFRSTIPAFEEAVDLYAQQVADFGWLANVCVVSNVVINSLIVTAIAVAVLYALATMVQTIQHKYVSVRLALSLPEDTAKKIYKFYEQVETDLIIMNDEDMEKKAIEQTAPSEEGGTRSPTISFRVPPKFKPSEGSLDLGPRAVKSLESHVESEDEKESGSDSGGTPPKAIFDNPYWQSVVCVEHPAEKAMNEPSQADRRDRPVSPPEKLQLSAVNVQLLPLTEENVKLQRKGMLSPQQSPAPLRQSEGKPPTPDHLPDIEDTDETRGKEIVKKPQSPKLPATAANQGDVEDEIASCLAEQEEDGKASEAEFQQQLEATDDVELASSVNEPILIAGISFGTRQTSEISEERQAEHSLQSTRLRATLQIQDEEGTNGQISRTSSNNKSTSGGRSPSSGLKPAIKFSNIGGSFSQLVRTGSIKEALAQLAPAQPTRLPSKVGDLELREPGDNVMKNVSNRLLARQSIYYRTSVYAVVLACMLGLCILGVLYPSRHIKTMVNLGPTTNQGGRRRYLVRSCVHLARELVLNDGASRMRQAEIAGTLRHVMQDLKESDEAIRLGTGRDITIGADYRLPEHNQVMYQVGCIWREDPTDCTMPGFPGAAADGLYSLLLQFFDSLEKILDTYGPPKEQHENVFGVLSDPSVDGWGEAYDNIEMDMSKVPLLSEDKNVAFVLSAFNGDLFQGLGYVLSLFKTEMKSVLEVVHRENRLFFGVYVATVIVCFYVMLFRKTMEGSYREVARAKEFVNMIPTHTLDKQEVNLIKVHFIGSEMAADSHDH